MRPTRSSVLVAVVAVLVVVVFGGVALFDPTLPAVPTSVPVVLGVVTLGVLAATLSFRRRLEGRPGARPYDPLHAARMVVLAKACSHGGAVLAGGYGGLAIALFFGSSSDARRTDSWLSAAAAVVALALLAVGLYLEHTCRVPPSDDDTDVRDPYAGRA